MLLYFRDSQIDDQDIAGSL